MVCERELRLVRNRYFLTHRQLTMKPTRNNIYCKDCGKSKMLFESEKKANNFIKFNGAEIESECGYSPQRSYYCVLCGGWHVTSQKEPLYKKTRTEKTIELYEQEQENIKLMKERNAEIKKERGKEKDRILNFIEKQLLILETIRRKETVDKCHEITDTIIENFEFLDNYGGSQKKREQLALKFNALLIEIENSKTNE
jgi:ssDNA-binding Zn-finger/Zn-ribbon topoisomerase 1